MLHRWKFLGTLVLTLLLTSSGVLLAHDGGCFTLSLQAIQSNFTTPGTPLAGNNGNPIVGLTIPVELDVKIKKKGDRVTLNVNPVQFIITANGFMISQTSFPVEFAPRGARWIDFNAGFGLEGHVFRDGSIRFSGPGNTPLTPGTYFVKESEISYKTRNSPTQANGFFFYPHEQLFVRNSNFPISQGQSNISRESNSAFDYGEYFGIVFREGKIYTSTTDNSFNNAATPIAVFNEVDKKGCHLSGQINIVPPGFGDEGLLPALAETDLTINPTNPLQLATTIVTFPSATIFGGVVYISNDGGQTWNIVDPLKNIPGPLPTLPGFGPPVEAGDQEIIFDSFGNLFWTPLMFVINNDDPNIISTIQYVLLSSDGGNTWSLLDTISGVNPETFGLDYPIIATGPGPDSSSVTWLILKQDVSLAEILGLGASLPQMVAAYQMTGLGQFSDKKYQEIPGSTNGGYGTISVGPDGGVLVTGTPVNNTVGGLPFGNNSIWCSYNKCGFNGTFPADVTYVANTNAESFVFFSYYTPMRNRGTWSHPSAVIDNNGRWYLVYLDQPTTHAVQSNPNVYLIYSDDLGKHWSTPVRLNNDVQNLSFHVNPNLAVDPFTNDLAVAWLDTREDSLDASTRVWATVIKNGSLPKLTDDKRKSSHK